ncbi:MAG: hypothetical protein PHN83_04075 [Dysgonamonadaceae bacterium]|jgi:hypothetical protein|nr:hypothetical protein [Dysgonamonadaceae bacterium]
MNDKIYIPSKGPGSWKELLAQPEKQWKTGFSAKTMAYCWEDQNGFPKEFYKPLKDSGLNLDMLIAIPEYKVYLDNNKAPSQNDLFVLSKDSNGLAVIMIVHSFSQLNEWFNDYLGFVRLLNPSINSKIDEINKCKTLSSGIDLYIGWIKGDDKYLKK